MVAEHGMSEGNRVWQAGARNRRQAALAADPSIATHGLASTYQNWRCRCRPCTDAHSAQMLRLYRARTADA